MAFLIRAAVLVQVATECKIRPPGLSRKLALASFIAFWFLVGTASEQRAQTNEYEVKAAYLYNFARFTDWPQDSFPTPSHPIVIGVVGDDPFKGYLEQAISGKTANGRSLVIRRYRSGHDVSSCHILFISASERNRLSQIVYRIRDRSVFTVSETEGFLAVGGLANFIIQNNKVRFEINLDSANRARLKLSSKLIVLARVVKGTP